MRLVLNGEPRELPESATVADAVAASGVAGVAGTGGDGAGGERGDGAGGELRGVAVAVDGEVVPRSEWPSTALSEGRQVEVLQAVQGG